MEYNDKIKNLTDKIYREGIEKANENAQVILSNSEKKATIIIGDATKEAEKIITKAKKEASGIAQRMQTELRLSSQQSLGVLRKDITELIQAKVLEEPIQKAFEEQEFMKKILELAISKWDHKNGEIGLDILLPEDKVKETEKHFRKNAASLLNNGLSLKGDENIGNGFEIKPNGGNYKICITDSAYEAFLKEHFEKNITDFLFKKEN